MSIPWKDLYHGAVLTGIVDFPSFTALNKLDDKYGHYVVNIDTKVLVKYSADDDNWQFTFGDNDIATLRSDIVGDGKTYLCLVCGLDGVCILNESEVREVLNIEDFSPQSLQIKRPAGGSYRVNGSKAPLAYYVPVSAFPSKLFE